MEEKTDICIHMSSGDESDFDISVDVIRLTKSNYRLNCECKMINVKIHYNTHQMCSDELCWKKLIRQSLFFLDISIPEDAVFHGLSSGIIRFLGHFHISIQHVMKRYHSDHKMYVVMNFVEKSWSGSRFFSWTFLCQKMQFFTGYLLASSDFWGPSIFWSNMSKYLKKPWIFSSKNYVIDFCFP